MMEISFVVSHRDMTELSLTSVSESMSLQVKHRAGGRTEDNAVIHDKTHVVLFASNEYLKFIFQRDFPANGIKFINKRHQTYLAQLSN